MIAETSLHEVGGLIVEVRPTVDDILMASVMIRGLTIVYSADLNGWSDYSCGDGVADARQHIPIGEPTDEDFEILREAIRQRRSGEVVPDNGKAELWQHHLN